MDKWHLSTFIPRSTVLMPFSTHGVTQGRMSLPAVAGGCSLCSHHRQGPVSLPSYCHGFFLRTNCDPNSALGTVVSPGRSRSHVSEQTLAPFAIWELEHHFFFLNVPFVYFRVSV